MTCHQHLERKMRRTQKNLNCYFMRDMRYERRERRINGIAEVLASAIVLIIVLLGCMVVW